MDGRPTYNMLGGGGGPVEDETKKPTQPFTIFVCVAFTFICVGIVFTTAFAGVAWSTADDNEKAIKELSSGQDANNERLDAVLAGQDMISQKLDDILEELEIGPFLPTLLRRDAHTAHTVGSALAKIMADENVFIEVLQDRVISMLEEIYNQDFPPLEEWNDDPNDDQDKVFIPPTMEGVVEEEGR